MAIRKKASQKTVKEATRLNITKLAAKIRSKRTIAEEPMVFYTTRIRAIGNSKGVILNNQLIESAGLKPEADIVIHASEGVITIMQLKEKGVNTDLSSWDKQFKATIKKGVKPETDMFEGMKNDFDSKEW